MVKTCWPRTRFCALLELGGVPVSGMLFSCPVVPALVLGKTAGLPPVIQNRLSSRISPPTRIEVSVPGIRNERGKLPPVICTLTGPGPPRTPYGSPAPGACASWSTRRWRSS
jgi:hypothetical protein